VNFDVDGTVIVEGTSKYEKGESLDSKGDGMNAVNATALKI